MFKEAHTISYVQQANHEWIKGNEEESSYAQGIESLKVVPPDIQQGLRFYRGSKQPTSPWSKFCFVYKTWKTMVNQLS
jgi:hypothetical protein